MIIGIDVYTLTKKNITGIGRYTLEMIKALSKNTNISIIIFSPLKLNKSIKEQLDNNIQVVEFNFTNKLLLIFWFIFWFIFLDKIISRYQLDYFWGPSHKLPKKVQNIKYIVTIHDLVYKVRPELLMTKTRLFDSLRVPSSMKKADVIITVSDSTKNDIKRYFGKKNKVFRIYPGSSLGEIKANHNELSQKYILFVGTIEPRKNIISLINAYSKLSQATKNKYKLFIVGAQGWGGVDLNHQVSLLGLDKFVKIYNYVDNRTLIEFYKNASLFVYPSLYEGFGLPILEAMSYGVPVVCSESSSMPEVVGKYAVLIDPNDEGDICNKVQFILDDESLQKRMSQQSLERARCFSWNNAAKELYQTLLN